MVVKSEVEMGLRMEYRVNKRDERTPRKETVDHCLQRKDQRSVVECCGECPICSRFDNVIDNVTQYANLCAKQVYECVVYLVC